HLPKLRLKFGSIRGALHFKSLCNKAPLKYRSICPPYFYIWLIIFSYRLLGRFFYLTSLNDQHIKLIKMSVNMEMFYKELIMT
ncbi:hypothetical protein, partial [Acinetobacter baumannii]|uniref:hypothetical protein n=1 Tax=Acinetobacter baumannii TaxID=470 RepID=UPI001BB46987